MTHVTCLTPPGSGAVAVLLLAGPNAWNAAQQRFTPRNGTLPTDPPVGRVWFGHVGAGDGQPGDDAVLVVRSVSPPLVEVHSHGGVQVVDWLIELFRSDGLIVGDTAQAARALWGEGTRAEALARLPQAPTVRTASILLDQAQGAYDAALQRGDVATLARYASVGAHLIEPWQVVIAGPPNAGKSSLVNAIAGYQRSIVTPIPGTTRDLVTTRLAIAGWPVELTDTAGLRESADTLEQAGVQRAEAALNRADLIVWLLAPDVPTTEPPPGPVLRVWNKRDLGRSPNDDWLALSANTGEGLEAWLEAVAARLVPDPPPPGAAVPFTPDRIAAHQRG